MTQGSLFSGIGALDLAGESNGVSSTWNCEINDFRRALLKKRFPNTKQYEDIRELKNAEYVDIISGGFPCQDISIAGRMSGVNGTKSQLWREMWRVCRESKPRYIIIENSNAILNRGFETILEAFAEIGYYAEWQCLRGYQFGTPQRRLRLYAILYTFSIGDRMEERQIFTGWNKFEHPTWWDTKNRIYGVANDVPDRVDRHSAIGDAVQPIIGDYLMKCILHNEFLLNQVSNR